MAKKTANNMLVKTAVKVGRTLGRVARGVDKVKSVATKSGRAKAAAKKKKGPPKDPVAAAKRAKTRATWRVVEGNTTAVEQAQHGAVVDERALVRATAGKRFANRKPR